MRRLLVAEDDEVTRTLLAAVLRKEGYEVREVADGNEAARLGASEDFDLVILDLGLPGLGGIEACRRIRAARSDAVVMFLTASGSELDAVAGLDAGAVDYVTKPFGVAELLARVRAHTRRVRPDELVAGRVRIDRSARQAWLDEEELRLSPREFDLLEQLVMQRRPNGYAPTTRRRPLGRVVRLAQDPGHARAVASTQARRRRVRAAAHHHGARGGPSLPAVSAPPA